jgi:uncharacterized membrane protein
MKNPSKEVLEEWRKNDSYWKCGVFYYNPHDERIFPPKRIAWMGWTVNFANSKSIASLLLFIVFLLFMIFLIERKIS